MANEENNLDDDSKEDLRVLYQTSVREIEYFKSRQWTATHYAVLTYAAVVGVAGLAKTTEYSFSQNEKFAGLVIIVAAILNALLTIRALQDSLEATRTRVDSIVGKLSKAFRDSYSVKWSHTNKEKRDVPFPTLFCLYIVGGALMSGYMLDRWF